MNNFMQISSITKTWRLSRKSLNVFFQIFLLIIGFCVARICLAVEHSDGLHITNIMQSPDNPVLLGNTVSYTLRVENTGTQNRFAEIQITLPEQNISDSFTPPVDCYGDGYGTAFFCQDGISAGQSTSYTFTWQPSEGQHNLAFVVDCQPDCVGDRQSITTNVIQVSSAVNQLKTISGNLQRGTSGTTLEPFVINALDAAGNPVENVSVNWEILPASGGTLPKLTTTTDTSGQSSNTLSLDTSDRVVVKATANLNNNSEIARNAQNAVSVIFVVNGGIADRSGLTKNQRSVAKALDPMCIALAEMGEGRSAEQNDMLVTCQRLETDDLTIIAASLDLLAHEEVSAQGRVILETGKLQSTSIHRRLIALRGGAQGINLSGLNIRINGQTLPASIVTALFGGNTQGGSAGEKQGIASRWGSFVNATIIAGDKDKTSQETGFKFRAEGITAGADYRISNKLVIGGALGYTVKDSDFKGNAGNMDINNWHLTTYGSYYRSASFYLDGLIRLGRNNIDTRRRINLPGDPLQEGVGDTTGWEYAISLSGGYEYNRNALTFGPYGRLGYIQTSINGYTESASNPGGVGSGSVLTIDNQNVDSITAVLGSQVSYAISARDAVYLLQLNGEWEHEFRDNSRAISAQFAYDPTRTSFNIDSDSPDRNYFNLGLGVTAVFANGRSGFFHYESRLGQDDVRQYWINGGIKIEL